MVKHMVVNSCFPSSPTLNTISKQFQTRLCSKKSTPQSHTHLRNRALYWMKTFFSTKSSHFHEPQNIYPDFKQSIRVPDKLFSFVSLLMPAAHIDNLVVQSLLDYSITPITILSILLITTLFILFTAFPQLHICRYFVFEKHSTAYHSNLLTHQSFTLTIFLRFVVQSLNHWLLSRTFIVFN